MPPPALAVAVPLLLPLQVTDVELALNVNAVGCDRFNETEEVQPVLSVTVAVYIPAHNPLIVLVVLLLLHMYLYGKLPPVPPVVICPVHIPLQVRDADDIICEATPFRLLTVTDPFEVQPLASVTVTE